MKKWLTYIRYFFYIGWHWNFRLAAIILHHEIAGERKYGMDTCGIDDLTGAVAAADRIHASIYQPVNFLIAEWLFGQAMSLGVSPAGFLDAGCGKGRTLIMAAAYGFREIYGFDISPRLCHEAIHITGQAAPRYPHSSFAIECCDAADCTVPDCVGVIFLFNPFDAVVMTAFIQQVHESLLRNPRPLTVLYANPECRNLWEEAGFVPVAHIRKLRLLEGLVLQYVSEG